MIVIANRCGAFNSLDTSPIRGAVWRPFPAADPRRRSEALDHHPAGEVGHRGDEQRQHPPLAQDEIPPDPGKAPGPVLGVHPGAR